MLLKEMAETLFYMVQPGPVFCIHFSVIIYSTIIYSIIAIHHTSVANLKESEHR